MVKKNNRGLVLFLKISVLIFGFFLLLVFAINPTLEKMLAKQIELKLLGNFNYTYESLEVDLWTGSVAFKEIKWSFPKDSTAVEQEGSIEKISINGIALRILLGDTDIKIDKILFDNPEMLLRISDNAPLKDSVEQKDKYIKFSFYSLFQGKINSLRIRSISIKNGNATWISLADNKVRRTIKNAQLQVDDIELDAEIAEANNGWFSLSNVHLDCAGGELFLPDSLHKIKTGKIHLDYKGSAITIDSIVLVPLYAKSEMSRAYKFEIDWIDLLAERVDISAIDLHTLMVEGKVRIANVLVEGLSLNAFRDKTLDQGPKNYLPLPQVSLKNLGVNIKIDSVNIKNATIIYEERNEKTKKSGTVSFTKLNAQIYHITNDSISCIQTPTAKMRVNTKLMGKIDLNVDFGFVLNNDKGDHWLKGSIKDFDLKMFNPVCEPLSSVSIRSGKVEKINFDVRLNDHVADGKMTFLYSDLKIDMLDENYSKSSRKIKTISFLANTFLVKKSNPSGKKEPRIGIIHFERLKEKSIFHFWSKSLLTGVKSTLISTEENKK
ncbi:MAG: hypothetical protein H0V01_09085 [Bacteroidetes bacterium]|nr:hypothetical protein [Bacteroidota bacterium]HET6244645.1 hypothetical protein [Bacteroidia bacterium]